MMSHDSDTAKQCLMWTGRVQTLLISQALAVTVLGIAAVTAALTATALPQGFLEASLCAVWLIALLLHYANHRLIGFGPQAVRGEYAPTWLNRPDIAVRLLNHILVNWASIAITIVVVRLVEGLQFVTAITTACIVATLLTWLEFNFLHKRFNRGRNLLMSSVFAAVLTLAAVSVLYVR